MGFLAVYMGIYGAGETVIRDTGCIVATGVYQGGAVKGSIYHGGPKAKDVYQGGSVEQQGGCADE